jgi:RimJ/RimL family protein N-acetyltransferase
MRHDIRLTGSRFSLRPVELGDAPAIVALRTDPVLARFINTTPPDPKLQEAWIERYFDRAGDYYFAVVDNESGAFEGTTSIYELDPAANIAEWGRWILRAGSLAAVESVLLTYRVAFDLLGLEMLYCRTVAENEKVVSFHASCGLATHATLAGEFTIGGRSLDAVEQRLARADWPEVEKRLATLAARLNRSTAP